MVTKKKKRNYTEVTHKKEEERRDLVIRDRGSGLLR